MALWEIKTFDDEDDEEDDLNQRDWSGKDGIIFLVDCTNSMFDDPNEETGERLFDLCMKCAENVMKNKIVAGNKDLMGIVFFGTRKNKNPSGFKNIYIFQELEQPGACRVLEVQSLIEVCQDKFATDYGHSNQFSLSDALWTCSTMFSNCSQKLGHKRLLLFTCNDDPHEGKTQLQNQAKKRAADLFDVGIEIYLMHLKKPEISFEISTFYQDIIQVPDDEITVLPNAAEKLDELMTRVRRKDHKKRALSNVPFCLGKGINLSVGVFSLVLPQKKPTSVSLYKQNNEIVKTSRKYFDSESGEVPFPSDIKLSQKSGNKVISFEKDEVSEMKQIGKPGITLLGFKPRSALKMYHHIRPAHFIYPNESKIKGSAKLFSALLKKCLEREVVAICWIVQRQNVNPRIAALLPQAFNVSKKNNFSLSESSLKLVHEIFLTQNHCKNNPRSAVNPTNNAVSSGYLDNYNVYNVLYAYAEILDDSNVQIEPPGFHVIYLPYSEDIRSLNIEQKDSPYINQPTANDEQISKAKEIIKKLQFKFDSEAFDNPALQTHFRNIEALALNQDSLEEITDYTAPNYELMSKRAGKLIQEFKDVTFPEDYIPSAKKRKWPVKKQSVIDICKLGIDLVEIPKTNKDYLRFPFFYRQVQKRGEAGEPKLAFTQVAAVGATKAIVEIDVENEAKAGRLGKLTVPVLKSFVQKTKIVCGTRKAELIDGILNHFGLN
ncbi:X-ray repair cross-complementing protein 6 [Nymphon striatum]|nr:X-ray repair cross-complementing protein 6 [Nymphon striatum]